MVPALPEGLGIASFVFAEGLTALVEGIALAADLEAEDFVVVLLFGKDSLLLIGALVFFAAALLVLVFTALLVLVTDLMGFLVGAFLAMVLPTGLVGLALLRIKVLAVLLDAAFFGFLV